jgi:4-hydroxy-tetrahydrodipicolinate synthase
MDATKSTPLAILTAHTPIALQSLILGVDGLSPIAANFYSQTFCFLINNFMTHSHTCETLQEFLTQNEKNITINYPEIPKNFLKSKKIIVSNKTRASNISNSTETSKHLTKLSYSLNMLNYKLGHQSYSFSTNRALI